MVASLVVQVAQVVLGVVDLALYVLYNTHRARKARREDSP